VQTCYAFGVQAITRHATVTAMPRACAGLSHEQIDVAVERAVRDAAGPHRKAIARRLAYKDGAYLEYLVKVVPPGPPIPPAAAPAGRPPRWPLSLAALAAWIVTVAAGSWLLAGWLVRGGLRRGFARSAGVPRAVVVGHLSLALAGLLIWIVFLAADVAALAWAAVGVVLTVAGLGMATLAGGLPEAVSAGPDGGGGRTPVTVIALHGMLAATTILLVVLAAVGAA
jgi:hypothetical protein